jgi:hypothetical protein
MDSRLTWRDHVDVKGKKAHNLLWTCKRAYGVTWGSETKVVHWIYVSYHEAISFTSLVWWPGWQTASAKKRLSRVKKTCTVRDNESDAHYCY